MEEGAAVYWKKGNNLPCVIHSHLADEEWKKIALSAATELLTLGLQLCFSHS